MEAEVFIDTFRPGREHLVKTIAFSDMRKGRGLELIKS
jgi:hypothetical protein